MNTLQVTDANNTTKYMAEAGGDGSSGNPFVPAVAELDSVTTATLGTGTPNTTSQITVGNGQAIVRVFITGLTASGATLTPEASGDGTNWQAKTGFSGNLYYPTLTVDGVYKFSVEGFQNFRLRVTSTGSGSATIVFIASVAESGFVDAAINCSRNLGVLHRSAIAAADVLATIQSTALTVSDQTGSSGALAQGTNYYVAVVPYNKYGSAGSALTPTLQATAGSGGSTHSVRVGWSQVTGADGYDLFLGTSSTAPLWVGRVTESQRATGGVINTVATYGAGGIAGAIDIGVLGTGLAVNVPPFLVNNAYVPAGITPISCIGYSRAHVKVKLTITDPRSNPQLNIIPFFSDQVDSSDLFAGQIQLMVPGSIEGQAMMSDYVIDVDGSTGLSVLISTLSGQGAVVSIWIELVK